MYDICHPTYYNMSQLGCNDQVRLTTAFYVYMELCEVKRYWDVEYKYSKELQLFYLEAKKSKNATIDTFIPWPAMNNITLNFISKIQRELNRDKFTFVFKEGDTTSVYYSMCLGIVQPISPEESKLVKQKEEKKYELEKEICRNAANLYGRALLFNDNINLSDQIKKPSDNNFKKSDSDIEEFHRSKRTDDSENVEFFDVNHSTFQQTGIVKSSVNTNENESTKRTASCDDMEENSHKKIKIE